MNMLRDRQRVIIIAYAISPNYGSEFGVAWNYVNILRTHVDITLIYGCSEDKMGSNISMNDYLSSQTNKTGDKVEFIYCKPNRFASFLNWCNLNISNLFFIFALREWQRSAVRIAKKLHSITPYDIGHQLNPIGYRSPGYLFDLNIPWVIGPVGGTGSLDKDLFEFVNGKDYLRHILRNISNLYYLRHCKFLRKIYGLSSHVFCATNNDYKNISKSFTGNCSYLRENNLQGEIKSFNRKSTIINMVWIGRVDGSKCLSTLLHAISRLELLLRNNVFLHVVGNGPALPNEISLAESLGINQHIKWHGRLSRDGVIEVIKQSDIHILTSIMDSNPTVIFEAMEYSVPTIALNQFGASDILKNGCGVLIDIGPKQKVIDAFADKISKIIKDQSLLLEMKESIKKNYVSLTIEQSAAQILNVYKHVSCR